MSEMGILDRRDRSGLAGNVAVAIIAVLLMNGFIALVNPDEMSAAARPNALEPPGYVIGLIWVLLFAVLGAARWMVLASRGGSPRAGRPVVGLLLFCLAYPVYTLGLTNQIIGLIGNIVTFVLAVVVAAQVSRRSRFASVLIVPVVGWLAFALYLTIAELRS